MKMSLNLMRPGTCFNSPWFLKSNDGNCSFSKALSFKLMAYLQLQDQYLQCNTKFQIEKAMLLDKNVCPTWGQICAFDIPEVVSSTLWRADIARSIVEDPDGSFKSLLELPVFIWRAEGYPFDASRDAAEAYTSSLWNCHLSWSSAVRTVPFCSTALRILWGIGTWKAVVWLVEQSTSSQAHWDRGRSTFYPDDKQSYLVIGNLQHRKFPYLFFLLYGDLWLFDFFVQHSDCKWIRKLGPRSCKKGRYWIGKEMLASLGYPCRAISANGLGTASWWAHHVLVFEIVASCQSGFYIELSHDQ